MTKLEMTKGSLPDGWRWVKLDEICKIKGGKRLPAGSTFANHKTDYPYIRVVDFSNGSVNVQNLQYIDEAIQKQISQYIIHKEDVFISIAGSTGIVGVIPDTLDGANLTENAAKLVIINKDILDRDYLANVLNSKNCIEAIRQRTNMVGQPKLALERIATIPIPLPPLDEQRRITAILRDQMASVEKARAAAQARLKAALALPAAFIRETLQTGQRHPYSLGDCLVEVRNGVGPDWSKYPVLGATRSGLSPAREGVGKAPERYKLVDPVTVFYNPMRILLGSIAMVDEGDPAGITSPDYVVVKGRPGILDTRWFYYWFRSAQGAHLIDALSRGAVRERILFNRLALGKIEIPDYETQLRASIRMKQIGPIVNKITEELQTIDALPATLLRRAFNGDL